jgi:hypothetical protein
MTLPVPANCPRSDMDIFCMDAIQHPDNYDVVLREMARSCTSTNTICTGSEWLADDGLGASRPIAARGALEKRTLAVTA